MLWRFPGKTRSLRFSSVAAFLGDRRRSHGATELEMLIELRASDDRLRGPKAVDAAPILTSAYRAIADSMPDLSRVRVIADYIQYRQNFREPVELRKLSRGTST